ncbi:hypothetical protein [Streptomyces sp. NPDC088789]|uniref:hypothetical protein n=1 Tax=Streptomyces sp. NPDC088789 TaxID=3365899 RepID=UPI003828561F
MSERRMVLPPPAPVQTRTWGGFGVQVDGDGLSGGADADQGGALGQRLYLLAQVGGVEAQHQRDETVAELTAFKELAVSRLAAQHDEIVRLREQAAALGNVRRLPATRPGTAPYGSCSWT